jgi:hypothetical protein
MPDQESCRCLCAFSCAASAQKQTRYTLVDQQILKYPFDQPIQQMQLPIISMLIFKLMMRRYVLFFYWTASNISYDVDKMVALNNKEVRK